MKIRNVKIGARIVLSFVIVLLLAMCMLSSYIVGNSIAERNLQTNQLYSTLDDELAGLETGFLKAAAHAEVFYATGDAERCSQASAGADDCLAALDSIISYADVKADLSEYLPQLQSARDAVYAWKDAIGADAGNSIQEQVIAELSALSSGINLAVQEKLSEISAGFSATFTVAISLTLLAVILGYLLARFIRQSITIPLSAISAAADKISIGDLSIRLDEGGRDEISHMSSVFNKMADSIREQEQALVAVAQGDLTVKYRPRSESDSMGSAIQQLIVQLSDIVSQIISSADSITLGSSQVAGSSQGLAQGTAEQAAAIEQLSASITQISDQSHLNAEKAAQAHQVAVEITSQTEKGQRQMESMVAAVTEINRASQSISKVIKVIDNIAFQTNILALNAAVEAARAGQHGKGFAVVAGEVRSLASKSAQAARETTGIIEMSVRKAEEGAKIAEDTSYSLEMIMMGISQTTELMSQISSATQETSLAIEQINSGISQVGQVVQTNSASSEESASAADELSRQADNMSSLISRFNLRASPDRELAGHGGALRLNSRLASKDI